MPARYHCVAGELTEHAEATDLVCHFWTAAGGELALSGASETELPTALGDYELVVGGENSGRVLGHRQFARYYRQKYRAGDPRQSVAINRVLAQCALAFSRGSPCTALCIDTPFLCHSPAVPRRLALMHKEDLLPQPCCASKDWL